MLIKFIKFLFKGIVVGLVTFGGSFGLIFLVTRGTLGILGWNTDASLQLSHAIWYLAWGIKFIRQYMKFDWLFGGKDDKGRCKCNSECK